MRLADKLLSYIHGAFDKSPKPFVAFRARHTSDAFRYVIQDYTLSCFDGGVLLFSANLNDYTLASLVSFIGSQTGMSIVYSAPIEEMSRSACVLLEGSGEQLSNNGDCFSAYTSLLWSYLDSLASALSVAKATIESMIDQMSIKTADEDWLDEWGSYFGVARDSGETDADYSNRIIVEVMRPRGNNKAIELALLDRFGQASTVTDLVKWKNADKKFNSAYTHNSAIKYDATNDPYYGLFDVVISYDLLSGADLLTYAGQVRAFVERFRDAGTHMESLSLSSSLISDTYSNAVSDSCLTALVASLSDSFTAPADTSINIPVALAGFADAAPAGTESASMSVSYQITYAGIRKFDGLASFNGGSVLNESLL